MEPVEEKEKSWRLHLPGWVRDVAMKVLPWLLMGIIGASINLYIDNVGNKRDIERNSWRNDQQDERISRLEARQDKEEEHDIKKQKADEEWQETVLDLLQKAARIKR